MLIPSPMSEPAARETAQIMEPPETREPSPMESIFDIPPAIPIKIKASPMDCMIVSWNLWLSIRLNVMPTIPPAITAMVLTIVPIPIIFNASDHADGNERGPVRWIQWESIRSQFNGTFLYFP